MPASPGAFIVGSGSRCSFTSCRRDSAVPCIVPFWVSIEPGFQSRRLHSQPKNSSPAMAESGRWRTVTSLMRARSSRHSGGSNVDATRSRHGVERSHARSTM